MKMKMLRNENTYGTISMNLWYMTNHYFICGQGVTKEPPECLKAAIRLAYPEENGQYTGYKPGKNSKSN
jgi:hypothetical protein